MNLENACSQDKISVIPVAFLCDLVADSTDTSHPSNIIVASSGWASWFCNSLDRSMNSHWQIFSTNFDEIGGIPSVITIEEPVVLEITSGDVPSGRGSCGNDVLAVPRKGSTGRPGTELTLGIPVWRKYTQQLASSLTTATQDNPK